MKVTSEVTNVVFSRDGAVLLSTERYGRTVVLWRLTDQKAVGDPLVGKSDIVAAAFSPDDRLLAAGDSDGNVVLWDVASRKRLGGPIK
jgi:WD40 repeat protein